MNNFKAGDRVWRDGDKLEVKYIYDSGHVRLTNGFCGITVSLRGVKPIVKIKNGEVYE